MHHQLYEDHARVQSRLILGLVPPILPTIYGPLIGPLHSQAALSALLKAFHRISRSGAHRQGNCQTHLPEHEKPWRKVCLVYSSALGGKASQSRSPYQSPTVSSTACSTATCSMLSSSALSSELLSPLSSVQLRDPCFTSPPRPSVFQGAHPEGILISNLN